MTYRKTASFRFDSIFGVLLMVAFLVGMFFILRGLFWLLSFVAPVLLIAAFIMDRSVVINYIKWIGKTLKTNPLAGIAAIVFSILGYMLVCPYLFAKAFFKKKIKDAQQRYEQEKQGELIDFEELESKPNKETLTLPRLEKKEETRSAYDKMFE
jgi:hypothetical protein